jgi:hypothetical protein
MIVNTRPKVPKKRTRRAPSVEIEVFRFLLDRISDKDWGTDTRTRHHRNKPVPHNNPAHRIQAALNGDPLLNGRRAFIPGITHKMLWEHQVGKRTLCFTGNGRIRDLESLFLIDVDCKDQPNPSQARQYLDDLMTEPKVPEFDRLFVESSTSGGGAHAYGVMVKTPGIDDATVNGGFKCLQAYLRRRLAEGHKFGIYGDISDVELKGSCPVFEWEKGRCVHVQCGQLAKVPVTALDRPQEFLGLARIHHSVMRRLHHRPIEFSQPSSHESTTAPKPTSSKRKGSTRTHPIPRAVVEKIGSDYLAIARKYASEPIGTSGRHVATAEDVAIYLAITAHITLFQGEDKAMPSRRIGAIWAAMFKGKEVNRPHCVKRVAAIRNHLSDLGLIAWQDERYWSPDKAGKPGCETRKGVCCKYSLSKQIMEELGLASREEGVLGSRESTAGTDPDIIPFTQETIGNTRQNTTIDLDVIPIMRLEYPIIRPTRVGWASEYWGREAA